MSKCELCGTEAEKIVQDYRGGGLELICFGCFARKLFERHKSEARCVVP